MQSGRIASIIAGNLRPAPIATRISGYEGNGKVRKRSGPITSTVWPSFSNSPRTVLIVRTTPFTWGNQASDTMRMFTPPP